MKNKGSISHHALCTIYIFWILEIVCICMPLIHHCILYEKVGWSSLTDNRELDCYLSVRLYNTFTGRVTRYFNITVNVFLLTTCV